MSWVRIDDGMPEHPKVLSVGPLAFALDIAAICYCARNRTDGRVPRSKVRILLDLADVRIAGRKADALALADALVAAGRWRRDGDDFVIHDFLEYNPARADIEGKSADLSEIRRAAGRTGGLRSGEARRAIDEATGKQARSKTEAKTKPRSRSPDLTHSPPLPPHRPTKARAPTPTRPQAPRAPRRLRPLRSRGLRQSR